MIAMNTVNPVNAAHSTHVACTSFSGPGAGTQCPFRQGRRKNRAQTAIGCSGSFRPDSCRTLRKAISCGTPAAAAERSRRAPRGSSDVLRQIPACGSTCSSRCGKRRVSPQTCNAHAQSALMPRPDRSIPFAVSLEPLQAHSATGFSITAPPTNTRWRARPGHGLQKRPKGLKSEKTAGKTGPFGVRPRAFVDPMVAGSIPVAFAETMP